MINRKAINPTNIIYVILIIFLFLNIFSVINYINASIEPLVILTFILIMLISIFEIIKDKLPYSLNKTFWYYNLIFNFFAPMIQYLTNYEMWGRQTESFSYLLANLLILFSFLIYKLVYKSISKKNIEINNSFSINVPSIYLIIMFIISIICYGLAVNQIGFLGMLSRTENSYKFFTDSTTNTIVTHLIKCIPVYTFLLFFLKKRKLNIWSIILLIIIILLNFPTSTTRFWMGAILIGLFLLIFYKLVNKGRVYDILILVIFTIIFPMLFVFKFHDINYFLENGIELESITESFNSVDYDAYSMIYRSIEYVDTNGIIYGKQVVGSVLFLIPRSIWPTKPYPTGELIASSQGQNYTNVSCPFVSEGYVNFGVFGVVIFQAILSLICSKLDKIYWTRNDKSIYLKILYPFLMGFLIYFLRGALHPAVVYLFCFCIPILFIYFINFIKKMRGKMI